MGLLERFGMARKPVRRRLGSFELQRRPVPSGRRLTREEIAARVGILAGLVGLTVLMFPAADTFDIGMRVRVGDVWQREEVIAPFSFPVYKTEEQLAAERDSIRYDEPPVFARVPDATERTQARLDSLRAEFDRLLTTYRDWRLARLAGDDEAARRDSLAFAALFAEVPIEISAGQWELLAAAYTPRPDGSDPPGPPLHPVLIQEAGRLAARLLPLGVLDVPKDSVLTDQITVVDLELRTEGALLLASVYGRDEVVNIARNEFAVRYPESPQTVALGTDLFDRALQPSLAFQEAETRARWAEREARISRTVGLVQEGEAIVRRGDYITEAVQQRLESLARIRAQQQGGIGPVRQFFGQLILSLAAFAVFFCYLYFLRRPLFDETRYVLLMAVLFAAIIGFFGVAVRIPNAPSFVVPVALASILLTVIFDSRVGMFATVTLALIGGVLFGYDFEFTFATVVAGMFAVFTMRDVKNRGQIILTAGIVFVAYLAMLGGYALLRAGDLSRLAYDVLMVAINAGLLLLAYPLIIVFERGFGVTTDLSLLELSDMNRPLLKELSLRAPGTLSHVQQVANLAEAAADAVGANALQARVGALYHDIGKMIRPEYFIENQRGGDNPHDRITPYMSALIIAEHVKAGEELGREYGLPDVVLQFIPTHHGTTLMEYFYRKANELRQEGDPPVDEAEFRYPGPRPQTVEQGIVMLADSVEAASRSLDKPTPKRLEALIDTIFRARIEDGQLAETGLTFADLDRIKESFLSVLGGVYHTRVKYPDQQAEDEQVAPTTRPVPPRDGAAALPAEEEGGPTSRERASLG